MPSVNATTTAAKAFLVPQGAFGFKMRNLSDTTIYWRDSTKNVATSGDDMGMPLDPGQEHVEVYDKDAKNARSILMIHGGSGNKQVVYDLLQVQLAAVTGQQAAAGVGSTLVTSDNGPAWTSVVGLSGVRFTSADQSGAKASVTDAPTSGQKLVVTDLIVSVDTAMRVDVYEESQTNPLLTLYLPANGVVQVTPRGKLKLSTADKKLQVKTSAAGNVAVTAVYYSET